MTATPMSSAAADYMAGFKPGPKGTLPTSPFVGNERLGAMAKMGGDVKVKLTGKFEDGTDASVGLNGRKNKNIRGQAMQTQDQLYT